MKNILLLNNVNTPNVGDRLIGSMMFNILSEFADVEMEDIFPNTPHRNISEGILFSHKNRDKNSKYKLRTMVLHLLRHILGEHLYRLLYISYYARNNHKTRNYDIVIMGGGELLKSNHFFLECIQYWVMKYQLKKCKFVLYGISSDIKFTKREERLLKYLLNKMDCIYVRDRLSQSYLGKLTGNRVNYIPDIVFAFSETDKTIRIKKKNYLLVMVFDFDSLPISVKDRYCNENDYFGWWMNQIDEILQENNCEIEFSYMTSEDALCTERFIRRMNQLKKRNYCLDMTYNDKQIIEQIANSKIILTGRMHSMIIAKQYGVQIKPFAFKEKIQVFMKEWENRKVNSKEILEMHRNMILNIINN